MKQVLRHKNLDHVNNYSELFFFTSDANNKLQKEHTCLILMQKFPLPNIFHLTTIYPMCNCSNYQYLLSTIILTVLALLLHITSYGSC